MGDLLTDAMSVFTKLYGATTFDVTWRDLSLGDRDSETGWREKSYSESSIQMVIIPKGAADMMVRAGVYVRYDALGLTATAVSAGDEIKNADNVYYMVKTVSRWKLGSTGKVDHYQCDLTKLPLHD